MNQPTRLHYTGLPQVLLEVKGDRPAINRATTAPCLRGRRFTLDDGGGYS